MPDHPLTWLAPCLTGRLRSESESYYQQKMVAMREEHEAVRWKADEETRTLRDEFEAHKREQ